jgi:hypothetical protein
LTHPRPPHRAGRGLRRREVLDAAGEDRLLWFAQIGSKHPQAKPLRGFGGAGVLEIIEDWDGNTYRARGRLDDYSLERLMRFLTALHRDVRIIVDEAPRRRRGRVIVETA